MNESSTSTWSSVLLALSFLFVLCVSAGAESTKEIVDKVLTGPDAEKDAVSRTFQESSSDEAAGLFLKAYMEGDKKAQGNALLGLSRLSRNNETVTEAYLTIACSGRETAGQVIFTLSDRSLSKKLTPDESKVFAAAVRDGKQYVARIAARSWVKLGPDDPVEAAKIITEKFISQIKDPKTGEKNLDGAYITPRAYCLNQFLLAYRDLGEPAQQILQDKLANPEGEDAEAWLMMAMAATGAKDAGMALEPMLRDVNLSASLRVCATWYYAAALGEEARPLLTELLEDQAISDYEKGGSGSRRVVAGEALGELSRLDKAVEEKAGVATP